MSGPNACGGIALLISACKRNNIAWSPYSIRRAVENTARRTVANGGDDAVTEGHGCMHVEGAYDYLVAHQHAAWAHWRFHVTLPERRHGDVGTSEARGLYIRDPQAEAYGITRHVVSVSV